MDGGGEPVNRACRPCPDPLESLGIDRLGFFLVQFAGPGLAVPELHHVFDRRGGTARPALGVPDLGPVGAVGIAHVRVIVLNLAIGAALGDLTRVVGLGGLTEQALIGVLDRLAREYQVVLGFRAVDVFQTRPVFRVEVVAGVNRAA